MMTKTPPAVEELFDLHDEFTAKAKSLMERKNNDYRSGSGDPYMNFRGATVFGVSPVRGILLHMQDKMCRLATFDEKGELLVKDEGVEDSLVDIINYAVLCGGLIREAKNGKEQPTLVHPTNPTLVRSLGGYLPVETARGSHPAAIHLFGDGPGTRSLRGGQREGTKPRKGAGRKK